MNIKADIARTQKSIDTIKNLIESMKLDADAVAIKRTELAKHQIELSRLRRLEWEETHERLELDDDR